MQISRGPGKQDAQQISNHTSLSDKARLKEARGRSEEMQMRRSPEQQDARNIFNPPIMDGGRKRRI